MGSLQGKVALVTGGRRGIGRGICLALAAEGADVAVNDVEGAEQAEAVAQEIRELGRRALVAMADVAQPEPVQAMVDQVAAELGGLDILVNNAGVESIVPFLEITPEEWERGDQYQPAGRVFLCAGGGPSYDFKWERRRNRQHRLGAGGDGVAGPDALCAE